MLKAYYYLFNSNINEFLWPEVFNIVVYLFNYTLFVILD